jgi:hypothetical protein
MQFTIPPKIPLQLLTIKQFDNYINTVSTFPPEDNQPLSFYILVNNSKKGRKLQFC